MSSSKARDRHPVDRNARNLGDSRAYVNALNLPSIGKVPVRLTRLVVYVDDEVEADIRAEAGVELSVSEVAFRRLRQQVRRKRAACQRQRKEAA